MIFLILATGNLVLYLKRRGGGGNASAVDQNAAVEGKGRGA
jgi:hypothetical protein